MIRKMNTGVNLEWQPALLPKQVGETYVTNCADTRHAKIVSDYCDYVRDRKQNIYYAYKY